MGNQTTIRPPPFEDDLLANLTAKWASRVAVKQDELDLDGHFDPNLPDFPQHLVPVLNIPGQPHPEKDATQQILSAAWIAYNQKTAAIEQQIILPACWIILDALRPLQQQQVAASALHQTIIDEHYHILMCSNGAAVTSRRRGLPELEFDPVGWAAIRGLMDYQADSLPKDGDLIQVAFAVAAEMTINVLFDDIAFDHTIQPMNRLTVDLHRRDEGGHAQVFRRLVSPFYWRLGVDEREVFATALVKGLATFRAPDFEPWLAVANTGGMSLALEVLHERAAAPAKPRGIAPLRALARELELTDEVLTALDMTVSR